MRTMHWKAHLLPLLLLSLHSVSMSLAAICIFDRTVESIDTKTIAKAEDQETGKNWEPIRIVTSIKDLEDPTKYCKKIDGSVEERGSQGAGSECKDLFTILSAERKPIVMGILEKAIALHADRLLVQRAVGPLKIPDFSKHPHCKYFNLPAKHCTTGVGNADMVLYVGANRESVGGVDEVLSLGVTCAKSAGGRPVAGAITFGPFNPDISRHTVRIAAHQIAHALGFSYGEMNSRNMIVDKTVRDKPNLVAVVKSDKTKEMAQAHYGCSTAEGMELEDGQHNNNKFSHWERRNAKDELMAEPIEGAGTSFIGFYTSLTMAAFEDLGFYKANFKMAEHMEYGHNAECEFLTGKCMKEGVTKWPNMFCNDPKPNEGPEFCTTDRLGLGRCSLRKDYSSPIPSCFQYFTSPNKGGDARYLTDYCPVVEQNRFVCTNSAQQGEMPGSLFRRNSMCLDGSALKVKTNTGPVFVNAVCAEISCEGGSLKVKYNGEKNDKWHDCPEGKSLTPSSTSEFFVSGTIKCPKYKEVCTVAPDGSSLVPRVIYEPMEPSTGTSPTAPQDSQAPKDSKAPQDSQAPQDSKAPQDTKVPKDHTGTKDGSDSGGKSTDSSSVSFGLIPLVAFHVLSFAGYLIA